MRLIDADALKGSMVAQLGSYYDDVPSINQVIDEAPTIKPVTGKWVEADMSGSNYPMVRCSICKTGYGKAIAMADFRHCPNCGAEMEDK